MVQKYQEVKPDHFMTPFLSSQSSPLPNAWLQSLRLRSEGVRLRSSKVARPVILRWYSSEQIEWTFPISNSQLWQRIGIEKGREPQIVIATRNFVIKVATVAPQICLAVLVFYPLLLKRGFPRHMNTHQQWRLSESRQGPQFWNVEGVASTLLTEIKINKPKRKYET